MEAVKEADKIDWIDRKVKLFKRKTLVGIMRAWKGVANTARSAVSSAIREDLPKEDTDRLIKLMQDCLDAHGGEIKERQRSIELGRTYLSLNEKGKGRFLKILAESFDIDREKAAAKIEKLKAAKTLEEKVAAELGLREALEPPRLKILRQFNALPEGMKFLVDMREDLLALGKAGPQVEGLRKDLHKLLAAWFDVGLLDLVEISWDSPAALLEKLIVYEAVHKIKSWNDLKNRLDSDRRCFAFLHNKMPGEPLIFIEVALVNGLADSVQHLLDESIPAGNPLEADTAIFYSISNAQKGLAGISFGNFLIKRVVDKLSGEYKNLKTFATLSPVPGFRAWLDPKLAGGAEGLLLPAEKQALLETPLSSKWHENKEAAEKLKKIIMKLAAHYLLNEKKNGKALDPVANFHLSNGARLERINWLGDISENGMKQAAGIMVNYLYKLSDIDDNHESYVSDNKIVASKAVRSWLD